MAAGTILITQGTQTGIPIDTVGGTTFPISKIDVGNIGSSIAWQGGVTVTAGSIVQTIGTVNTGTVNAGTINTGTINAGTINAGTVNAGTIDAVSQLPPGEWGTTINTGTSLFGTIKALVAGSVIYVTDLLISVGTLASNVAIYSGGTANPIAGTFSFGANGGMVSNYRTPLHVVSGSALTYQQSANVQLMIEAHGFVK